MLIKFTEIFVVILLKFSISSKALIVHQKIKTEEANSFGVYEIEVTVTYKTWKILAKKLGDFCLEMT